MSPFVELSRQKEMNSMDIRIIAAFVSAFVAILIAVLNHFVIEPWKEKKKNKKERLKNLYAPLYGILVARAKFGARFSDTPKVMLFGSSGAEDIYTIKSLNELMVNNMGYASEELIWLWQATLATTGEEHNKAMHEFARIAIMEYQELKKELNLPYNKEEMRTGILDIYKKLRNLDSTN
jgi:hypothetical protein